MDDLAIIQTHGCELRARLWYHKEKAMATQVNVRIADELIAWIDSSGELLLTPEERDRVKRGGRNGSIRKIIIEKALREFNENHLF
jgi:hypothetical protein